MTAQLVFFYAFGALALAGAIAMVALVRNPVAAALSLVVTMVSLSGIYVLLEAHFVGAVQLLVYAGAILVLFLFVIMLLDVREDAFAPPPLGRTALKWVAAAGVALLAGGLASATRVAFAPDGAAGSSGAAAAVLRGEAPLPPGFGGFRDIGLQLFTTYVVPVELAGLLLLAAIVGAVILARPRTD